MSIKKILPIVLACAVLAALLPSALGLAVVDSQECQAQTGEGTMELSWDDGNWLGRVSREVGGCPACYLFQGVQFALPEGVSEVVLKSVRAYIGMEKTTLAVWVTDEDRNILLRQYKFDVKDGSDWYSIPLPKDVVVSTGFYVWIESPEGSLMDLTPSEPFYDGKGSGHSYYAGAGIKNLQRPPGDFLIRASIVPQAHVGQDQDYYKTIQEAVDSVWDGWTILVHEGTYAENVTVNKSVTIKSVAGKAKTTVEPLFPDDDVFKITASCVTVDGFTILGAGDTGKAGVRIEDSSGCIVSGNLIQDNYYGIYVSEDSTNNILLENECMFNNNGIYVDGSQNYLSGNKLHGNDALVGSAVFLSSIASGNLLRFNSISVDDPATATNPHVYNQNGGQQLSAVENWWGSDSGPYYDGNTSPFVGAGVKFDPPLTKPPQRVRTAYTAATTTDYYTVAALETSATVLKKGTGKPIVSVANFAENPAGTFPTKDLGKWVDVLFTSVDNVTEVEIRIHYTQSDIDNAGLRQKTELNEGSFRLYWWNVEKGKWEACSESGVDKENDFVWARVKLNTNPGFSDLNGTLFAVGTAKGGFRWWLIPLIIVIILILLVAFRLIWVLVVRRGRYEEY